MSSRQAENNRRRRRREFMPNVLANRERIALLIEEGFLHPDLADDREAIGRAIERHLDYYAGQPPE